MLDIDVEEELVLRVGGKFKLTTLLQKRLVELNRGAPPLVRIEDEEWSSKRVACEEILQGKIELSPEEEVSYTMVEDKPQVEEEAAPEGEEGDSQVIYGSDIKKIKEQRIKELSQLFNPKK